MAGTAGIRKDDEERSYRGVRSGRGEPGGPGGKARSGHASSGHGHANAAAALGVRPGERPWSEAELAEVRARLETEVIELRAEISNAESEIAARLNDSVGDAGDDSADAGAKTYQRERDL